MRDVIDSYGCVSVFNQRKKSRDFLIVLKNTVDFYGSLNDTTA